MYSSQSFCLFCIIPFFFFKTSVLINHSIRIANLGFHMLLYFEHCVFLALDNVFSYDTQRKQNKVINERDKCLLFQLFKCVTSKQYNSSRASVLTIKKPNHSPWPNTKVCLCHCWRNIQRFLLGIWQFFSRHIAEANLKILKLPWHFIADVLSTWISKAERHFPQFPNVLEHTNFTTWAVNQSFKTAHWAF